ncbi:MAG: sugar transferase [Calditrichaeota bacterium]|nr:sugar transferase [Calditrichota bacterium]
MKRVFDVVVSALVVLVALPLWALVALAIKLDSPGPVFHRARRIGKDGQPFTLYKFRTMVDGADTQGPRITRRDDPRISRVGRLLRRMKIDEMPQLLNVLKGEMSIVGPRPEDPRYAAHYTPEQRRVLSVRPGMASPAFIKYRHEEEILARAGETWEQVYLTQILPEKLRMDLDYVRQQSLLYDLKVFGRAALSLFLPPEHQRGASPIAGGLPQALSDEEQLAAR